MSRPSDVDTWTDRARTATLVERRVTIEGGVGRDPETGGEVCARRDVGRFVARY